MFEASIFLACMPSDACVRVQIAGVELPNLGDSDADKWSAVATGTQGKMGRDEFGRSAHDELSITIPITSLPAAGLPDDQRIGLLYPGETEFTLRRVVASHRRGNTLMTFVIGPLNG